MKILIVDDHKKIARSTSIFLRTRGFSEVETLVDSRKVMPYISSNKPTVVILDLSMPYISGEELITMIKDVSERIHILIISAIYHVETIARCLEMGAEGYFIKPIDHKRIIDCLNSIGAECD